jgi:hypothetical protein
MKKTDTDKMYDEYATGGLVSKNAMSDYFLASAGKMTEVEFVGKHKMSTLAFEKQFAEDNSVDIAGTEKLSEISTAPEGMKMDYTKKPKTMAEGGIVGTDPVSGNDIPIGSTAGEVRDDIPAMLSENEYVIPADVLKYFGVNFFEKLRTKAKQGMMEMEADGRTGSEPTEVPQEAPVAAPVAPQEEVPMMAEGGLVDQLPPSAPVFNPADFAVPGFSGVGTAAALTPAYEYKEYTGPGGVVQMILFVNGAPAQEIPAGFVPAGTAPVVEPAAVTAVETNGSDRNDGSRQLSNNPGQQTQAGSPLADLDFSDTASVDEWAAGKLESTQMQGLGLLPGVAGLAGKAISTGTELRDVASVSAAARYYAEIGDQESSTRLMGMANQARENLGFVGGAFEGVSNGDRIFKNYMASLTQETAPVEAPAVAPPAPAQPTPDRENSWDGGQVNNKGSDAQSIMRRSNRSKEEVREQAQKAADRQGTSLATGGRNKGGLVTKPKTNTKKKK